jgi:hypothetical protein
MQAQVRYDFLFSSSDFNSLDLGSGLFEMLGNSNTTSQRASVLTHK